MRILVSGATGALGRPLVRMLLEGGHQVAGMTSGRPEVVEELGATPLVANALDAKAVAGAVAEAHPEVIVNLLTRIPRTLYPMPAQFRENNRLRVEGTRNLIEASADLGSVRMIGESITFAFRGRSEEKMTPLEGMGGFQRTVEAAVRKEQQITEAGGVVLRFGYFYGPGTSFNEALPEAMRKRLFPIVGKGTGWWSFIHVEDAARATIAAILSGKRGATYNICDDEPILAVEALQVVAETVGAPKPLHLPAVGPAWARHYFNRLTGANNSKAKLELPWSPAFPTFREGYPATIGE